MIQILRFCYAKRFLFWNINELEWQCMCYKYLIMIVSRNELMISGFSAVGLGSNGKFAYMVKHLSLYLNVLMHFKNQNFTRESIPAFTCVHIWPTYYIILFLSLSIFFILYVCFAVYPQKSMWISHHSQPKTITKSYLIFKLKHCKKHNVYKNTWFHFFIFRLQHMFSHFSSLYTYITCTCILDMQLNCGDVFRVWS